MDHNLFDDLLREIIRPALNEVINECRAELRHKKRQDAYQAIRTAFESETRDFLAEMAVGTTSLDVHKQCACLCGAILKSRVLSRWKEFDDPQKRKGYHRKFLYPNEMLAVTSAMRLIKATMVSNSGFTKDDNEIIRLIESHVPYYPGLISDKHGYLSNMVYYLACYAREEYGQIRFDRRAYSVIFYHLDKDNRERVIALHDEQLKSKTQKGA